MIDAAKIINNAAIAAGKPLPLDDYDREFGEGLLRSLCDTLDWVYGRKPVPKSENIHTLIAKWKTEAEMLQNSECTCAGGAIHDSV